MNETCDLKKFQHFSLGLSKEQKHKSHHTVDSSKGAIERDIINLDCLMLKETNLESLFVAPNSYAAGI